MPDNPLLQLICDALGLMNPAFADPAKPRSVVLEFYHQFRKLWDRGIPVGMGLGHLVVRQEPGFEMSVHRLGEGGRPDEPLAAIAFAFGPPPPPAPGFRYTLAVTFGPATPPPGVTVIQFDPARRTATVPGT